MASSGVGETAASRTSIRGRLASWYGWVLKEAETQAGGVGMLALAYVGSTVVPFALELPLLVLTLSVPRLWRRFSLICFSGSTLGGYSCYAIGYMFMHSVGLSLVKFWGAQSYWEKAVRWVAEYGFAIVFAVSLGPGPTKIVAMAAGAAGLSFPLFAFIHASCRLARYGTIGWFSHIFGDRIRVWLASNHPRRVYATVTLAVLSIVLAFLLTRLLVWG